MTKVSTSPNKPLNAMQKFENTLKKYESSVARLLQNKHGISPDEFMITAANAIKKNPKLLDCDSKSLFAGILLSAELGLKINSPEGHAYLIPFGKEAQFIIGYKGLTELAYRSERVLKVSGEAVYENDEFEYEMGINPTLKHKPLLTGNRGKLIAAYAVVKLKDAEPTFAVATKDQLDKIQALSPAGKNKNSPYNNGTDVWNMMQIKAPLKRCLKLVPTQGNSDLHRAIKVDDHSHVGGGFDVKETMGDDGTVDAEVEIIENDKKSQSGAVISEEAQKIEVDKMTNKESNTSKSSKLSSSDNQTSIKME